MTDRDGSAVEVSDTSAVLNVDRWFRGGEDGVTTADRLGQVGRQSPERGDRRPTCPVVAEAQLPPPTTVISAVVQSRVPSLSVAISRAV